MNGSNVYGTLKKLLDKFGAQLSDIDEYSVKKNNAKGNGITDDTEFIQSTCDLAASNGGGTVKFPRGTYNISSTIEIDGNCSVELSNDATIKAISPMSCMFSYNSNGSNSRISRNRIICGGKLDGNNLADDLLQLSFYIGLDLHNVTFYNFKRYGLNTQAVTGASAELIGNKLYFRNQNAIFGAVAIYNLSNDNHFNDIIVVDVESAMATNFVKVSKLHSWISFQSLIPSSTFIKLLSNAQNSTFTDCYSDTLRYTFKTDSVTYTGVSINGLTVLWNGSVYTSEQAANYPPIIFGGNASNVLYRISNSTFSITLANTKMFETAFNYATEAIFSTTNNIITGGSGTLLNSYPETFEKQSSRNAALLNNNLNTEVPAGTYLLSNIASFSNIPAGASGTGFLIITKSTDFVLQIIFPQTVGFIYYRIGVYSTVWFTAWSKATTT